MNELIFRSDCLAIACLGAPDGAKHHCARWMLESIETSDVP
jgi:hypothetical protein